MISAFGVDHGAYLAKGLAPFDHLANIERRRQEHLAVHYDGVVSSQRVAAGQKAVRGRPVVPDVLHAAQRHAATQNLNRAVRRAHRAGHDIPELARATKTGVNSVRYIVGVAKALEDTGPNRRPSMTQRLARSRSDTHLARVQNHLAEHRRLSDSTLYRPGMVEHSLNAPEAKRTGNPTFKRLELVHVPPDTAAAALHHARAAHHLQMAGRYLRIATLRKSAFGVEHVIAKNAEDDRLARGTRIRYEQAGPVRKDAQDRELAHSLKVSQGIGIAAGTIGLTALGAKGGAVGLRRANRAAKTAHRLNAVSNGALVSGAGLGGVGAFYGAKVAGQQSRQALRVQRS